MMIAMLAAHAGIQCQRVAAYCNSYVSFIQTKAEEYLPMLPPYAATEI